MQCAARYEREQVGQLAYQAIKYRQREGWTHADLLRLSHPKAPSAAHKELYAWMVDGIAPGDRQDLRQIRAFEALQKTTSASEAGKLIRDFKLPWEAVPTELRGDPGVWAALLEEMPMTAMIRNLATMTRVGLVAPMSKAASNIATELRDRERVRKA